jgi:TPR repeat protein
MSMTNRLRNIQYCLVTKFCMVLLFALNSVQCGMLKNPQATKYTQMEKLALQNDPQAQFWLANNYWRGGEGVPKDLNKALYWEQKAAEQKHPEAQYRMGVRYEDGYHVEKNSRVAIKWYEACANNGFGKWQSDAQASLGLRCLEGDGVTPDPLKAYEWYSKSALQGNDSSLFFISALLLNKKDKEDQLIGRVMLETAASKGLPQAQCRLALYYSDGMFLSPDFSSAMTWARKASDQGYARAQCLLGNFLLEGRGGEKDEKKAAMWCIKAAEQGDSEAQVLVAKLYTEGRGVPADKGMAKYWIKKWASSASSKAEQDFKKNKITTKELNKIREMVTQVEKLP